MNSTLSNDSAAQTHDDAIVPLRPFESSPLDECIMPRIYVNNRATGTSAYSCKCGKQESGFLHAEYARDAWREAHDLEPIVDYPLV